MFVNAHSDHHLPFSITNSPFALKPTVTTATLTGCWAQGKYLHLFIHSSKRTHTNTHTLETKKAIILALIASSHTTNALTLSGERVNGTLQGGWYSLPQAGRCLGDMPLGTFNCTWRVAPAARFVTGNALRQRGCVVLLICCVGSILLLLFWAKY